MTIDSTAALARVAAAEGDAAEAGERCRAVLEHWQASDDHHYALAHAALGRPRTSPPRATATARTRAPRR